ncbi:MAG: 2-oxoacid:ferredoxin oxidoreductase subunit beta, partial [Thermoanaerobaculia bacterium]
RGTALVEIYQNCNIFNDHAFEYMTGKDVRESETVYLEHGEPVLFGPDRGWGIRIDEMRIKKVRLGDGVDAGSCLVWDETNPVLATLMAHLLPPEFPTPIGILHAVEKPSFEEAVSAQIQTEIDRHGMGQLAELLRRGDTWTVEAS